MDLNCLLGWKNEYFKLPWAIFFSSKFCGHHRKIVKIVPYVIKFDKGLHWTLLLLCINYLCIVYSGRQLITEVYEDPYLHFALPIFSNTQIKSCFHKIWVAYNIWVFTAGSLHKLLECRSEPLKYKLGVYVGIFFKPLGN